MALYNFYHDYDIRDDNIWCGQIIVSECDWTHVYRNPCDVFSDCLDNLPQQLTSDCVVDFLNSLDTQQVWDFLRIDSSHCLEAVPLNLVQSDRLVAVDDGDTPGELEDKIVWCDDISITKIWPAGARQMQICFNWPRTFPALNDVPDNIYNSCSDESTNAFLWKYLKVNNTHNWVTWDCTYKYLWSLYLSWNVNIDSSIMPPNEIKTFLLGSLTNRAIDQGMYMSATSSGAHVVWWPTVWVIRIPVSWIWRVSLKGNVQVNPWVQSIRMFVVATEHEVHGCVDCKFGAGNNPLQPMVWKYDKPLNEQSDTYVNMWGDTMVYINEWTYLTLWVKIDSNAGTTINPLVTIWASWITWWSLDDPDWMMNNRSGTSLQVEFIRSENFDEVSFA